MVDIFKLFIAVTFPTEMLKEVLNIFVIGLKALLRIAAKTSSAFHLNKFAAMLDCTMWRVVELCQGKVMLCMVSWTCCLYLSIFINLLQEMILSSILSWLCSFSIPSQWLKLREYLPFSKNWFIISTRGWETTLCLLSDSSSKSLKEDENVAVNNSAPLDSFGWDCPSPDEEGYELHGSRSLTKDKMHDVAAESVILACETFSYFLRFYFWNTDIKIIS